MSYKCLILFPCNLPLGWIAPPGESDTPIFQWPDAPDEDVFDNDKALEPVYKPTQAFKAIPGYEQTTIKESKCRKFTFFMYKICKI